jgi:hypothetical protein
MPICIYNDESGNRNQISQLCDNEWELPCQIYALGEWLKANQQIIQNSKYVADIGFRIRKNATGGGAVISTEMIQILNDLGMEIYLSEYGDDFSSVK